MNYLVTGGAGFIGSNLVDRLIELGHTVHVVDNLSTGNRSFVHKKAKFHRFDLAKQTGCLKRVMDKTQFDGVFHLAALPRVVRSVEDPAGTNYANVQGTVNVFTEAKNHNIKRVVYSSSSSVYGDQETHMMNEPFLLPNPLSPYALQKHIGEQYARMFNKLFGMSIISLRYFNVYGPRQSIEGAYALVIGKFIKQRNEKKELTVYGDGNQTRDFTHVSDVVEANIKAMHAAEDELPVYKEFNIGTNKETSVNDIANLVGGKQRHIIPNPRGEFEELRKCADISQAATFLNWTPKVTIESGISELL